MMYFKVTGKCSVCGGDIVDMSIQENETQLPDWPPFCQKCGARPLVMTIEQRVAILLAECADRGLDSSWINVLRPMLNSAFIEAVKEEKLACAKLADLARIQMPEGTSPLDADERLIAEIMGRQIARAIEKRGQP
jgi:hypothetical protein